MGDHDDQEPMVHVVIGWDDDNEGHYVDECSEGDYDDSGDRFEASIPRSMLDRVHAASREWAAAIADITARTGIEDGKRAVICPTWRGDITPASEWWTLELPASGDPDVFPAGMRAATLQHFDTADAAAARLAALPPSFQLLVSSHLVDVDRSRLEIHAAGWTELRSGCFDCGHSYEAHLLADDHQGITDEVNGDG